MPAICRPERSEAKSKDLKNRPNHVTRSSSPNQQVTPTMRHLRPLASLTLLATVAAVGLLAAPRPAACQDDSLQKVVDGGVLRVAAEPGTPPMLYKEGPRYVGFN